MQLEFSSKVSAEAIQSVIERKKKEREEALALRVAEHYERIQKAVDKVVDARRAVNKLLRQYDDALRILKNLQNEDGQTCPTDVIKTWNQNEFLRCQFGLMNHMESDLQEFLNENKENEE